MAFMNYFDSSRKYLTYFFTIKTDRHDIAEILLKVALNVITLTINITLMQLSY
jgi:hypothetical protein